MTRRFDAILPALVLGVIGTGLSGFTFASALREVAQQSDGSDVSAWVAPNGAAAAFGFAALIAAGVALRVPRVLPRLLAAALWMVATVVLWPNMFAMLLFAPVSLALFSARDLPGHSRTPPARWRERHRLIRAGVTVQSFSGPLSIVGFGPFFAMLGYALGPAMMLVGRRAELDAATIATHGGNDAERAALALTLRTQSRRLHARNLLMGATVIAIANGIYWNLPDAGREPTAPILLIGGLIFAAVPMAVVSAGLWLSTLRPYRSTSR